MGVFEPDPTLLGGVDDEQPTEGPERLPTEVLLALLVQQQHRPTGDGQLGRGDQAREPATHHDHVGVHHTLAARSCSVRISKVLAASTEAQDRARNR
jgi:hypothetical protein